VNLWTKTVEKIIMKIRTIARKVATLKEKSEVDISHSSFGEGSVLLGCDTVPLCEWLPTLRKIIMCLSSRINQKV